MTDKTKEFLQKLKDSDNWNDNYDYSKVDYVNSSTKVIVIDKKFGTEHLIRPNDLIQNGSKCCSINLKDGYLSFEEAREIVRRENISNRNEWNDYSKNRRPHNIPSNPNVIYKNKGFISMRDFFLHEEKKNYIDFYNAREYVRKLYLKNKDEWKLLVSNKELPSDIPVNPDSQYKDKGWVSWRDFLYSEKTLRERLKKDFLDEFKNSDFFNENYDFSKINFINLQTSITVIDKEFGTEHEIRPDALLCGTPLNARNIISGYVSWDKLCSIIKPLNFSSSKKYKKWVSENRPNDIPLNPQFVYDEFVSWAKLLGHRKENANTRNYIQLDELITLVKPLKLKTRDEYYEWVRNNDNNSIPLKPFETYKNDGWESWDCLLLREKRFLSFEDFKNIIKPLKFRKRSEYTEYVDKSNREDLPKSPNTVYADDGWNSWFDILFDYTYDEIKSIVNNLDFKTNKDYVVYARENDLPVSPDQKFKNKGWISWGDFLGTGNTLKKDFIDYYSLKKTIQTLSLKSRDEFLEWSKEMNNIPTNPHVVYKNNGWISWGEFIGTGIIGSHTIRKNSISILKELINTDLLSMDPVELQIIIQQGALPNDFRPLINTDAESDERIATLRELQERYESDDESQEENEGVATAEATSGDSQEEEELIEVDDVDTDITEISQEEREPRLPSVNAVRDLHSLDNSIYASMDEEAFETLIQYKIRKYWNETLNEVTDISKLRNETGGKYFTSIKDEFLDEYDNVLQITPSEGYAFKHQPNLMQKLTVYRLLKNKHYGNWSGTGAGKTLSFILASRNLDAKLTVVIALNSTIKQTCKSIKEVYPNSKCFTDYKEGFVFDRGEHNYLVLNYEKFQQENSEKLFQSLTNNNQIDFVVIDEVHNAKQRIEGDEHESIRRGVMVRLLGRARENDNLHVLAMSATPVINELFEAKSLLQLMSGLEYNDLQTRRTIGNAIKIFQQLTLNGLRFIPKYDIQLTELTGRNMTNLNIDGSHLLDRLLELPQNDYIGVEKLILDDKLKAVTSYIRKGTIIYTYFTTGIVNNIQKHVESLGFKVGTYTGDESSILRESNLKDFISGKIDVLIGSRPIGTGVDGLQGVSDRMICITLPWTDSEYTQLKGRIYRQGSDFDEVEIIIPQVRIQLEDGDVWSWDIQRLNLIKNKKTLADAAVDGVIPSNILPSKETMFRKSIESLKNWQDRVSTGNIVSSERNIIRLDLYPDLDSEDRERIINSELSEFNRRGKITHSSTMHKEFTDNPDSWHRYHALRKSRMESWEEIPYEYIATKIKDSRDVVADFGCGENLFKHCVPNNKVYSFDHVAIDETVVACDMRNTGLIDEIIDVAVFSLALWGTNSDEYIKEAYRILRRKGMIYIAEPSKNYETLEEQDKLINVLNEIGFQQVGLIENRGKFVYLTGIKI